MDATWNPAHWRVRFLEFEIIVVDWAGIKKQSTYALSQLQIMGSDDMRLHDGLPVLMIQDGAT